MVFSFTATIAHWIDDDWKMVERLIDFHHMGDKEHAGAYAAKAFMKSASSRGSLQKMSRASLQAFRAQITNHTSLYTS